MRKALLTNTSSNTLDMVTVGYSLWTSSTGKYKCAPYSTWHAYRINRLLRTYPKGTLFLEGEEPQFRFNEPDLPKILKILGAEIP